jgi:hypothetical protein
VRRLLVTHRTVVPAQDIAYESAWRKLRDAMTAAGANAWRFRHASLDRRYLEFVEWTGTVDPTVGGDGEATMAALDAIAPGSKENWTEAEVST